MPDEHAGGSPSYGHKKNGRPVAFQEWIDDVPVDVPVEYFQFDALDSLDDEARECLAKHGSLKPIIAQLRAQIRLEEGAEAVRQMLWEIRNAKDAVLEVWVYCAAFGLIEDPKLTGSEIARLFGISKQDFQQLVKRRRERFGARKTRTMRDEEASQNMSLANFRHGGGA